MIPENISITRRPHIYMKVINQSLMTGCSRLLLLAALFVPTAVSAQWTVVTHRVSASEPETRIAQTTNPDGYTLEIYRDSSDAIRSRLTLKDGLIALADKSCPTYQIDRGQPRNRSINDAPCISSPLWAEFILGHVKDGKIESSTLHGLMVGINITFRFILANGDYRETRFSLAGSMRTMQTAFGQDIVVTASNP